MLRHVFIINVKVGIPDDVVEQKYNSKTYV